MTQKSHALALSLVSTVFGGLGIIACGDESRPADDDGLGAGGAGGLAGMSTPTPSASTPGSAPQPTNPSPPAPSGSPSGAGGNNGIPELEAGGSGGMMAPSEPAPMCEISSLRVFSRSDTEEPWDDNDFSDVLLEGYCPLFVNVTWPHEDGWEDADPSDANFEQTHFTLDSYAGGDLTGKQLNLTIELTGDERGPNVTTGGYVVSLVSVSTYDRIQLVDVPMEAPALDAGVDGGATYLDASVDSVDGGYWDAGVDAGLDGSIPGDEPETITVTGYSEAESHPEDRILLRHVGDRATITFPLPDKTAEVDSYDPTRVIKINVRIYNMFTSDEMSMSSDDIGGGMSTMDDAGVMSTMDGGIEDMTVADAGTELVDDLAEAGAMGMAEDTPNAASGRVYDYGTTQFAITWFAVTDAGPPAVTTP